MFFQGFRLKVEILSLFFDPSSSVALDQSVQQVYVEYRLLGIPMETTETPMSLQKPTEGEEIHFNFSRGMVEECSDSILTGFHLDGITRAFLEGSHAIRRHYRKIKLYID